jgi:hypothetical protein
MHFGGRHLVFSGIDCCHGVVEYCCQWFVRPRVEKSAQKSQTHGGYFNASVKIMNRSTVNGMYTKSDRGVNNSI